MKVHPALILPTIAVALCFCETEAYAYKFNDHIEAYAYTQIWLTLHEQMEDTEGLYQNISHDEATNFTTGFRIHRARFGTRASLFKNILGGELQIKLEGGIAILDLNVRVSPIPWLDIVVGQLKFPSTRENLTRSYQLNFIQRARISVALADYSLSRTTYASSLFAGNESFLRDLGLGLKSSFDIQGIPIRLFFMIGNGLGANLFVGGNTAEGFIITNGQFFYGGRLEIDPWPKHLSIGGHFNFNKHDNIVFNSGRTVYDLHRLSYSADLILTVPRTGLRVIGMYGAGQILEDYDQNDKTDFIYSGWHGDLLWELNPLLHKISDSTALKSHRFELVFRYENYMTEADESGIPSKYYGWTFGFTYAFLQYIKLQFNAILRRSDEPFLNDLDDDTYILSLQFYI
jgi:hypothetical protein